jgi:hypothetical protein
MSRNRPLTSAILATQAIVLCAFTAAWFANPLAATTEMKSLEGLTAAYRPINVTRTEPLVITPLYDRPDFITDGELAAVLGQIQPRFAFKEMKPNHVEHALRTWGLYAKFNDPDVRSGEELALFLTDTGRFIESWGEDIRPLLQEEPTGVAIRWGQEKCGSVHHDHCLASLTEAGARIDMPVYGMSRRNATLADVLQESLRDFRLDERETEWTALAFGLWLPTHNHWIGGDGREYSFDLIAKRLMRGQKEIGVCSGTHRVYSLMVLIRLDDQFAETLSDGVRADVYAYLTQVRDAIILSQFSDGHWPSNWPDGADAVKTPVDDDLSKKVIATGHHLEWLAIAPRDLHPPDEQIRKAFRWAIDTTVAQTQQEILDRYTFFSHVGSAGALWRKTSPGEFWATKVEY